MRYLVTGGAGFIGSNLAFTLADERKANATEILARDKAVREKFNK